MDDVTIYLYHFSLYSKSNGAGTLLGQWHYTSYEKAMTHPAFPEATFSPVRGLTHGDIRFDSEKNAGQLKVTVPRDFNIAMMFLAGYPTGSIYLRVIELDAEVGGTASTIWRGKIRNCEFHEHTADLTCTNGNEMLQRLGLRYNAGSTCQHDLYGTRDSRGIGCGVDPAPYTRTGHVISVSSDGLTVATTLNEADDYFKAGLVEAMGQVRQCNASTGGILTLMNAFSGLQPGDTVVAKKGCDRSASACKSFNNYTAGFSAIEGFETPRNVFTEGVK